MFGERAEAATSERDGVGEAVADAGSRTGGAKEADTAKTAV